MLNVLLFIDGGWLVDEIKGTDCLREEQLKSLRRQYIPSTTCILGKTVYSLYNLYSW